MTFALDSRSVKPSSLPSHKALAHDVPAFVVVNNKAEGSAPATIIELARAIVALKVAP